MLTIQNEVDTILNLKETLNVNMENKNNQIKTEKIRKINLSGLSHFQKTLLITDGTVTELLEFYLEESIKVEKLYEELETDFNRLPDGHKIEIESNDFPVLVRKVLLQGKSTLKNWLYAESSILIDRLTEGFRDDLLISHMPIGKLWAKYRLETYKTNFNIKNEKASKELADLLNIPVNSQVLSRTYCVYSHGKKTMVITEKFSTNFFRD
jgi:chorismate-pyruvate lyase